MNERYEYNPRQVCLLHLVIILIENLHLIGMWSISVSPELDTNRHVFKRDQAVFKPITTF